MSSENSVVVSFVYHIFNFLPVSVVFFGPALGNGLTVEGLDTLVMGSAGAEEQAAEDVLDGVEASVAAKDISSRVEAAVVVTGDSCWETTEAIKAGSGRSVTWEGAKSWS